MVTLSIMPFGHSDIFEVSPLQPPEDKPSPWLTTTMLFENSNPDPVSNEHKKAFGIEWAKLPNDPFKAALNVFGEDTTSALWASRNWILDPNVNAIKDSYIASAQSLENLLDRDETARKLLAICDEKTKDGRPAIDAKDRLKALELYAKMRGYMDDALIKNTINNNNTTNNKMEIVFVEPDIKNIERLKVLENIKPDDESKILKDEEIESSLGIKLVG